MAGARRRGARSPGPRRRRTIFRRGWLQQGVRGQRELAARTRAAGAGSRVQAQDRVGWRGGDGPRCPARRHARTRGGDARGEVQAAEGRRRGDMHLPMSERLRTHDEDADGGGRGVDGGGQGPCNRGASDAGEDTGGGGRDVAGGDCGGSEQPRRTYCGQGAFLAHCHAGSPQLWADPDACAGVRRALCRPRCQEPPRGTERDAAGADFPAVGSDS